MLKLAAKNAKLTILVGWIGAALGIIGDGMIWGGEEHCCPLVRDVHSCHPQRKQ